MTTTTPNHRPADQILEDDELESAKRLAQRQNRNFRLDQGYTAQDVADEARANIYYFAKHLAQAEALLALTQAETEATR